MPTGKHLGNRLYHIREKAPPQGVYGEFQDKNDIKRRCKKTVLSDAGHPVLGGLRAVPDREGKRAQEKKAGERTGQIEENLSGNLSGKLFCQ